MQLIKSTLFLYELLLSDSKKRHGSLLRLEEKDGKTSWGEIAPLPGYSKESLEEALLQTREILPLLLKTKWAPTYWKEEIKRLPPLYPSVSFGIESALLSLLLPLPTSLPPLPLAVLLMGTPRDIAEKAEKAEHAGITCAKLKLGSFSIKEAIDIASSLLGRFSLRIDTNRAWSLAQALSFSSAFSEDAFAFFEEPLMTPSDLFHFPYPTALDESLRENNWEGLLKLPSLKALVIKPTLQGGFIACETLSLLAKERGLQLILSSSFESGVGIAQIASFAHRLNLPILPMGFDTYSHLQEDLLQEPLNFSRGSFSPSFPLFPKLKKLTQVPSCCVL